MDLYQFSWPPGEYYFERPWTLDDVTYLVTMRYNLRIATWFMDLADATGATLVCGVPLVPGRNLLKAYQTRAVPKGVMYVFAPQGSADKVPGEDDFTLGYRLVYTSDAA